MFYNSFYKIYTSIFEKCKIEKDFQQWLNDHPAAMDDGTHGQRSFREQVWDKLTPQEQEAYRQEFDRHVEKEGNLMAQEVEEGFSKPKYSAEQLREMMQNGYQYALRARRNLDPPPTVTAFPPEEQQRRKALSDKVRPIVAKMYQDAMKKDAEFRAFDFLTKEDGKKQLPRDVLNIIGAKKGQAGIDESNKVKAWLSNPTPENLKDRQEYLDNKISGMLKLAEEMTVKCSDEEFVEKYADRYTEITALTEIQFKNYQDITDAFGCEPSSEIKEKWQQMNELLVSNGTTMNRFGLIANPYYSVMSANDIGMAAEYLGNDLEDFSDQIGYHNTFSDVLASEEDLLAKRNKTGNKEYAAFIHAGDIAHFSATKENLKNVIASATIPAFIRQKFGCGMNDIQITTPGKTPLDFDALYDRLYEGKKCLIYDKNDNLLEQFDGTSFDNSWGGVAFSEEKTVDLKIDFAQPAQIKTDVTALKDELKKATRWYMPSSDEFTKLRKAIENFSKNGDFSDLSKTKESMKDISQKAHAYLALKEKPGTKISDITRARIAIAEKIALQFDNSLSQANKRETEKQIAGAQGTLQQKGEAKRVGEQIDVSKDLVKNPAGIRKQENQPEEQLELSGSEKENSQEQASV